MARIDTDIQHAADLLSQSQVIGIPTETVYGLAGNAYDPTAIAKIFVVKGRPHFDPLIVHTSSMARIGEFVEDMPAKAALLSKELWPGPLTMIFRKKPVIPDLVTAGLPTVAVRIPNHPLTLKLLKKLDFPLAAPSANPFGYISPTCAAHVDAQLGQKIGYVLDGGSCAVGIESTILSFKDENPRVLRLGGCTLEHLQALVGTMQVADAPTANPQAPGMLKSHYAPRTPFLIGNIPQLVQQHWGKRLGVLSFSKIQEGVSEGRQFVLSEKADLAEAATRLFTGLRKLDSLNLQLIVSEYVPDEGLGRAINDRLSRAEVMPDRFN